MRRWNSVCGAIGFRKHSTGEIDWVEREMKHAKSRHAVYAREKRAAVENSPLDCGTEERWFIRLLIEWRAALLRK